MSWEGGLYMSSTQPLTTTRKISFVFYSHTPMLTSILWASGLNVISKSVFSWFLNCREHFSSKEWDDKEYLENSPEPSFSEPNFFFSLQWKKNQSPWASSCMKHDMNGIDDFLHMCSSVYSSQTKGIPTSTMVSAKWYPSEGIYFQWCWKQKK